MSAITFADVAHPSLSFSKELPADALVLALIDSAWVQRLRDISQTANTRLVYMFSEHSRFGHCLGVAYLAKSLMDKLAAQFPDKVEPYRLAVSAAAILHDIGHIAPGSHTAYKTWFPGQPDHHEKIAAAIIDSDSEINRILEQHSGGQGAQLAALVTKILCEDRTLPAWTWQIISGGGWNVDRGNWCIVDSVMAGVSYGRYNIDALTDSITITSSDELALTENRLDAMTHFMVSRQAMYRQMYQHRVLLAADMINRAVVERARDLGAKLPFCDEVMSKALAAKSAADLDLSVIFRMRESWWRYHVSCWASGSDEILRDLSNRLLNRRLFKTVRVRSSADLPQLRAQAEQAASQLGLEARYYIHEVSTS
ncbi:MAG: hypothetical protein DCC75_13805, partial [Proteobacteria bacterium]